MSDDPRIKITTDKGVVKLHIDNVFTYGTPGPSFPLAAVEPHVKEFYENIIGAAYRAGRKAGRSKVQRDIKDALGVHTI